MKRKPYWTTLAAGCAMLAAFAIFSGCEDDKGGTDLDRYFSDNPYISDPRSSTDARVLEIDPGTKTISAVGEKVSFMVKGGSGSTYYWAVANENYGTIERQRNTRYAVYTATRLSDNSVIVSDSGGNAGVAYVRVEGSLANLAITPSETTLTSTNDVPGDLTGEEIKLLVTGGDTPYGNWTISGDDVGTINNNKPLATFTVNGLRYGKATITIIDHSGKKTTATVAVEKE